MIAGLSASALFFGAVSTARADETVPSPEAVAFEVASDAGATVEEVASLLAGLESASEKEASSPQEQIDSEEFAQLFAGEEDDLLSQLFAGENGGQLSQLFAGEDGEAVVFDRMHLKAVGVIDLTSLPEGDVTAIVDMEFTGHVAEEEAEWTEVLSFTMTMNAETGDVVDLVLSGEPQLVDAPETPRREQISTDELVRLLAGKDEEQPVFDQIQFDIVGDIDMTAVPEGDVTAAFDIAVTGHLLEEDVDWVEAFSLAMMFDAETGEVLDFVLLSGDEVDEGPEEVPDSSEPTKPTTKPGLPSTGV